MAKLTTYSISDETLGGQAAAGTAGAGVGLGLDAGKIGREAPNCWRSLLKRQLCSKGKTAGGKHVGFRRRVLSQAEPRKLLSCPRTDMSQSALDGQPTDVHGGPIGSARLFVIDVSGDGFGFRGHDAGPFCCRKGL